MKPKGVCFDLGGVMVQIARDWEEACSRAGIGRGNLEADFSSFLPFEDYQAGKIDEADYLSALSVALGVQSDKALEVHDAILVREFPGIPEIVQSLRDAGLHLGCLSNTNALHWTVLTDPRRFPTVSSLQTKVASQIVKQVKPGPEIYVTYQSLAQLAPEDILFFDDRPENVEAALSLGWKGATISPESSSVEQIGRVLAKVGLLS